jgi:hypothetical protein
MPEIERMRTQVHRQPGEIRQLRDGAKADLAAARLGDAVKLRSGRPSADSGERSIFQDDGAVGTWRVIPVRSHG